MAYTGALWSGAMMTRSPFESRVSVNSSLGIAGFAAGSAAFAAGAFALPEAFLSARASGAMRTRASNKLVRGLCMRTPCGLREKFHCTRAVRLTSFDGRERNWLERFVKVRVDPD